MFKLRRSNVLFLDAIASVGLHMSVGWSVHVLMMEFLTDEHSVRSTLDGISLCNNSILMSASHWPIEISCSLAICQLLIGHMSASHWPTEITCSLAN